MGFESRFKKDMELDEAKQLVRDAIAAGVFNDLGSGSNIDLCVITKDNVDYIRPHDVANAKGVRSKEYSYPKGTTAVVKESVAPIKVSVVSETVAATEEGDQPRHRHWTECTCSATARGCRRDWRQLARLSASSIMQLCFSLQPLVVGFCGFVFDRVCHCVVVDTEQEKKTFKKK